MGRRTMDEGSNAYDSLIEAERSALSAELGREVSRGDLVDALGQATGLPPREARRAVDRYIARRGGEVPLGPSAREPSVGWIDDLLDAERADANRDDRAITRPLLVRAVRQASGLSPREAGRAVDDYLARRGGEVLRRRGAMGCLVPAGVALLVAIGLALGAWTILGGG